MRVPKGTSISQNMVAKEAGRDPPSFKKSRYPELVAEIKAHIASRNTTVRSNEATVMVPAGRNRRRRSWEEKFSDMKKQRDVALSMLVEADALIIELGQELEAIRAVQASKPTNVTPISSRTKIRGGM